jgi:hypothetical protein
VTACCDPDARKHAGHHAPECTDPAGLFADRRHALTVACPQPTGCGRPAGQCCVTAQGYATVNHRVRVLVARGGTPAPVRTDQRPSRTQARILTAAIDQGGIYLLTQYNLHGVAPLRQAMAAMVTKGWFEFREALITEDRYEITDEGRAAQARRPEPTRGRKR